MSGLSDDSSSRMLIRPAGKHDVGIILGFIKELAEYERLTHEVVNNEASLNRFLFGEHRAAEAIIAELNETPVGFALFFHTFSTFLGKPGLYLEDLYVKPNMRGQGFGRRLLRHVARLALERGCGRLEWSVLDWNKPAIGFYEKLGAQAMDDWTVYRLTGDNLDAFGK
ncbi:MAG: GNAT family N-acetyltransferase [Pseudomonadota bacterium]|nr:GNAT family N-acetyltransferase [Pseudomonadota bacterium]